MSTQPKLVVMQGLPGSGKTTFVDNMVKYGGFQIICRDDLRVALGQDEKGWSHQLEVEVTRHARIMLTAMMARKSHIILDETHTMPRNFTRAVMNAREKGYHTTLCRITTPLDVCVARRKADGKCPEDAIMRMHENLETNFPLPSLQTRWGDLFDRIMLEDGSN